MANTTHIVEGLKEAIIHHIDPSQLSDDLVEGLKEKEDLFASINPCYLQEFLDDYEELEELVDVTIGSNYTSLLLDRLTEADITNILPELELSELIPADGSSSSSSASFSGSIESGHDKENFTVSLLSGGTYDLNLWDSYEWTIVQSPDNSTVHFDDGWEEVSSEERTKSFFISFSDPGSYIISLRVAFETINAFVQQTMIVEVI